MGRLSFKPLGEMAADTARLEAESRKGIECPQCGCRHFSVVKTSPHDGEIGRRRECRHCGKRITTTEIPVG